ncbi:MAG TPA: hypothetical protein VH852_01045 [Hyphomicrobium sp.]|jgi:predicted flap endonuclease-1-like 5' DNA nuclease
MTELLWQTILLLTGAFFFGAVLACGLKRRFYYGPPVRAQAAAGSASMPASAAPVANAAQPKIEVGPEPVTEPARFEKALSGRPAAPAPAAVEAPSQLVVPPTTVRVEPVKEAAAPPKPQPAAALTPVTQAAPAALTPVTPAAPAAPQPQMTGIPRVSVTSGSGAPIKVEQGGAGPSDDLTRIRGIDPILQGRLKELGIRRFSDVAGLTPADVKGLGATLGLGGRIDEENWVTQAKVLSAGGETYYSRRVGQGIPIPAAVQPSAPAPVAAAAAAPKAAAPVPPPAAAPPAARSAHDMAHLRSVRSEALLGESAPMRPGGGLDDLKRIRGIGVLIERKLNSLGIGNYEQIANWTGADIERISRQLDFKGRIERENWIEQARILATGGQTEFSRRGG